MIQFVYLAGLAHESTPSSSKGTCSYHLVANAPQQPRNNVHEIGDRNLDVIAAVRTDIQVTTSEDDGTQKCQPLLVLRMHWTTMRT